MREEGTEIPEDSGKIPVSSAAEVEWGAGRPGAAPARFDRSREAQVAGVCMGDCVNALISPLSAAASSITMSAAVPPAQRTDFPLCTRPPGHAGQSQGKENCITLMKRPYEVTFIVRLDNTDEALVNGTIDQVRAWIEAEELGQVTKINRWGRKKLAYEIDRQREGYYVLMEAQIEPKALTEIERNVNLSPYILRHLVIRSDE
jgi:small subunit ribosomal protein S6